MKPAKHQYTILKQISGMVRRIDQVLVGRPAAYGLLHADSVGVAGVINGWGGADRHRIKAALEIVRGTGRIPTCDIFAC